MNNTPNNGRIETAANAFAERMSKHSIEEQIAVASISSNVLNGCSWEFMRDTKDIRENITAFENSKYCSAQVVTYDHRRGQTGYLVYMKLDRLLEILRNEAPGLIEPSDLDRAAKHHAEAIKKAARAMAEGYRGRIGIYCTNDSSTITINGKTFPAYAITLKELLQICVQYGYGLQIGDTVRDPNDVYKRADAVLKACTVAPSSNAILLNIAPMK